MIAVGYVLTVLALALLVVGTLAFARKLPGNPVIGIRVAEVRKTREVWDEAHHVAGALWLVGGVALSFGALISFIASGWLYVIPIATVIIALVAIAAGANAGAQTAARLDVRREIEEKRREESAETAPKTSVDLSAVRRAAGSSDGTTATNQDELD